MQHCSHSMQLRTIFLKIWSKLQQYCNYSQHTHIVIAQSHRSQQGRSSARNSWPASGTSQCDVTIARGEAAVCSVRQKYRCRNCCRFSCCQGEQMASRICCRAAAFQGRLSAGQSRFWVLSFCKNIAIFKYKQLRAFA